MNIRATANGRGHRTALPGWVAVAASLLPVTARAQHEHSSPPAAAGGGETQPPTHPHMHMHMHMQGPLRIPMTREASGTAWQPDSTPI